jgi:hypothetical protein
MSRFVVTADWDTNCPHLTQQAREDLWDSIPAYQRDARTKGIPQLGAGIIFPIPEEDILVDAFPVPAHWLRGFGLDVGWNRTAAIWRAKDPDTGISYLYDEHYRGEADPEIHAAAIRRRGTWIPGRIDPAARGRSQKDGEQLMKTYRHLIYDPESTDATRGAQMLKNAKNGVEAGLYDVLMALNQGMLKVMRGRCPNWLAERRLYRRNEKGEVVKKFDHAMDGGRYNVASGDAWLVAQPIPVKEDPLARFRGSAEASALGWMR